MMAEQAQPRSGISASKLRQFPIHSTYYNSFFALRTEVVLNGQPAEIGCSDDTELTLCCRYFPVPGKYTTTKPSVSFPSILPKIEEIFKSHGVSEVKGFFIEDSPLYPVSFYSEYGLKEFLKKKSRVEKEMAVLLSKNLLSPHHAEKSEVLVPTLVNATLFLITPDPATKECAKPVEVTLANYSTCMDVWKGSEVFDFGDLFRVYRLDPLKLQDQGEVSLTSVLNELEKVFEWFVLGSYLKVPEHELETIRLDHLNNNKECKLKMVSTWIKLGNASWSGLVRALWEIGRCGLAKKIAYKFGATLPPAALKPLCDQNPPTADQLLQKPQQDDTFKIRLLSSIEYQDHRLEEQSSSVEKISEAKTRISEERVHVKRCLSTALKRVELLLQAKEVLTTQLMEKELWLTSLQNSEVCLQSLADRLRQDIDRLKGQLSEKEKDIADITAEADSLRAQLQNATAGLVRASSELSELKTERESMVYHLERERRELEKIQMHSMFKESTINELKGEISTLRAEAISKAEESAVLKYQLSAQRAEIDKLQKALHETEERKPVLSEHSSPAALLQQQLIHTLATSDLRVKLAIAEEGRQEVERQLGALQRQVQLLEGEMKQKTHKSEEMCNALCTGSGLKEATIYRETRFSVHTLSECGETFEDPNAVVTGELIAEDGGVVKCQVSKKEENRYELIYQPRLLGHFELHVKVNGIQVKESPFRVRVVAKLHLAQGKHVKSIGRLNNPFDVAVSDSGEILVTELNSNCVSVFDAEGQKTRTLGNQGSADMKLFTPRGVAVLSDNTVLVTADHSVKKYRMDGTFIASVGSYGGQPLQFKSPSAVAADEKGKKIYIASKDTIQILNFDLSFHSRFGSKGSGQDQLDGPTGIAIDSQQNVFVADYLNHRVQVFNSEGMFQYQIQQRGPGLERLSFPVSVCIDRDDNVYVLEFEKCRVSIFRNKGIFINSFYQPVNRAGRFSHPRTIAVDNSGYIYIADADYNRIQIFS